MSDQTLLLEELKAARAAAERRAHDRYRCTQWRLVRMIARPTFQACRGIVRDISPRGVGLLCQQPFEPGTVLAFQFQSKYAGVSGILTGKVRHVTPLERGMWLVGCSFSRNLSDDEISAVI